MKEVRKAVGLRIFSYELIMYLGRAAIKQARRLCPRAYARVPGM